MADFRALTAAEAAHRLCSMRDTLLLCHTSPDGDTLGSAMALKKLLCALGGGAEIAAPDKPPEALSPLIRDRILLPGGIDPARYRSVVCVDVASRAQLGELFPLFEGKIDLMLDHHEKSERLSDFCTVPAAAAVGEIVFEIAEILCGEGWFSDLPAGMAEDLYLSISSDTGCFRFSNATAKTHRVAARLLEAGCDGAAINHLLFESRSPEELEAERITLQNIRLLLGGRFGAVLLDRAARGALAAEYFSSAIDTVRSVRGVAVAAAIKEKDGEDGSFKISLRSDGSVNVSDLCAAFGGGGHARAAGCSMRGKGEEVLARLTEAVRAALDGAAEDPS